MGSDEWERVRSESVAQSNGICDECHWPLGKGVPHTHHDSYDNFGHEGFDDTRVMHNTCHERKHPDMKEVKQDD